MRSGSLDDRQERARQPKEIVIPDFTLTRHIDAPVETVWAVLDDFGGIARWNPGVSRSTLTSAGPVSEGSTRHCHLAPFGGLHERIDTYLPNERMTVTIFEATKLPISDAIADFAIATGEGGTELTLRYNYTLNRLGRVAKGTTAKQLERGIGALADSLKEESERLAAQ